MLHISSSGDRRGPAAGAGARSVGRTSGVRSRGAPWNPRARVRGHRRPVFPRRAAL